MLCVAGSCDRVVSGAASSGGINTCVTETEGSTEFNLAGTNTSKCASGCKTAKRLLGVNKCAEPESAQVHDSAKTFRLMSSLLSF